MSRGARARPVDALVIGSGISGLAAALQLARGGRAVTLVEAGAQVGGLLRPVTEAGYSWDVGLQYVGQAGPGETFRRFLDELGVDCAWRPLSPDAMERYRLPGYEAALVRGREAQEARLAADFPGEAAGLAWFFDVVDAAGLLVGAGGGEGWRGVSIPRALRRLPELRRALGADIRSFLTPRIRDPLLQDVLSLFIGDIALPPSRASALTVIVDWAHFLRGAWYPVGGGGALVDAFLAALAPLDVEIATGTTVRAIHAGAPHEVELEDGQRRAARVVISCVDATQSLGWVRGARPRQLPRAQTYRPSLSAWGALLGVRGDLRELGLTDANLWHYESADLEATFGPLLEGRDAPHLALYACSSSLKDPDRPRAPEGHHALTVLTWAAAQSGDGDAPAPVSPDAARARVDDILGRLERALPGLAERIVLRREVAPGPFSDHHRARRGGLYGPEMSPEQSIPTRFSPWTGVEGLYLAGSSIFGCGVLPALLSGRIAAGLGAVKLRLGRG